MGGILDTIRVSILGPPAVTWKGPTLSIPRRQARALLYRMAADLELIPREEISFLFWPDFPESEAKRNLTHLLTHLRRAIPVTDLFISKDSSIGLNPGIFWSDAYEFKVQPHSSEKKKVDQSHTAALEKVISLYRGPFLSGFSSPGFPEYEAWLTPKRHAFEVLYLERLSELVDLFKAYKEYPKAIACANRYLETDELSEEMHRKLMGIYATIGDLAAVQRQFENCMVILERELSVSPLPETWAIYKSALENRTCMPASARRIDSKPIPKMDIPIIGRDDVLSELHHIFDQAGRGPGKFVLVSGEPGIGKTRLVKEYIAPHKQKVNVLTAIGDPGTRHLPYQLVTDLIRLAVKTNLEIIKGQTVWLAECSRLLPELRKLIPTLPTPLPTNHEEARIRLFEAAYQIISYLACGPKPLIIWLDDLHWADANSLEWLAYLGHRLVSSECKGLVAIGTYRVEEAERLTVLREALYQTGIAVEFSLNGLKPGDVCQLVYYFFGQDAVNYSIANRLYQISGGNPFFLLEILQSLLETNWVPNGPEDLDNIQLPGTIREAVMHRLERLNSKERQVLEAAAILGTNFPYETLFLTAGRSETETLESLEILASRWLIQEHEHGYQFRHELIQTAICGNLSPWRRRLLHRRAGEALEILHGGQYSQLAWHFERAGLLAKAGGYYLQAGINALDIFANDEAQRSLNRALQVLNRELETDLSPDAIKANQRMQIQVLSRQSWILRLVGEMDSYWQNLQDENRIATLVDDQSALANLRLREAAYYNWLSQYIQAIASAEKALVLCQDLGDQAIKGQAYREIGLADRSLGDWGEAQNSLKKALNIFIETKRTKLEIHTLGNLSTLYLRMDDSDMALEYARRALTRCEEKGGSFDRRIPLGDIGAAATRLGEYDLAQSCLQESLAIAEQIADRTQEIFCRGHLGWLEIQRSNYTQALSQLQFALELAERIKSNEEMAWLHNGLAEAYRCSGDLDSARSHARQALTISESQGHQPDLEQARKIIAQIN